MVIGIISIFFFVIKEKRKICNPQKFQFIFLDWGMLRFIMVDQIFYPDYTVAIQNYWSSEQMAKEGDGQLLSEAVAALAGELAAKRISPFL